MTSGAPIMSSQKIGPNSLDSRARFCTGALESSDSILPTTGLVGGCGIGLSRLVDAIAVVSPCLMSALLSQRSLRANRRRNSAFVIPGWSAGPDLRCAIAHRGISRSRVRAKARPGMTAFRPSLLHQRAARQFQRLERFVARNGREQLVIVPAALRFRWLLDLEQIHVVHHAAVLANPAVLGKHVVDRSVLHDLDHRRRIGGAG